MLDKYSVMDIIELQHFAEYLRDEFNALNAAGHKADACRKLYEILQIYSIKFSRIKVDLVDKKQIDILCILYVKLCRKLRLHQDELPVFEWRD